MTTKKKLNSRIAWHMFHIAHMRLTPFKALEIKYHQHCIMLLEKLRDSEIYKALSEGGE